MWNDLKTLFWLERKRLSSTIRYWTRLIGFDSDATRGYQFYVAVFWAFWIFAMWAYAVEQTYQINRFMDSEMTTSIIGAIPMLIGVLQVLFLGIILRDFPLKLRGSDLAYVVTAPVSRGAIALAAMIRALLLPAIITGLIGCLVAMTLTWDTAREQVGYAGLYALILSFLLTYLTGAIWWAISLYRAPFRRLERRAFWLLIPLLLGAGYLLPQIVTVLGQFWTTAIDAQTHPLLWGLLLLLLLAASALVYVAGNRLHGSMIIQHSAKFARIAALGVWGRMYAKDVIQRIEYQTRMAERQEPPRVRLPARIQGERLVYWHTLLLLFRSGWMPVLGLIGEGLITTLIIGGIILIGGWGALQTWLIVGLILLQRRPAGLVQFYKQTLNGNFLRQFIPSDLVSLFFGTTFAPIALMTFGGWMAIAMLPGVSLLPGFLLIALVLIASALCQAVETVN